MRSILEEIIVRLRNDNYKNEEHVRVAIVVRLLQALDWDIWNPIEVNEEFAPVRNEDASRVDVAVFKPPQHLRPAIFFEVKAVGKLAGSIDLAERQLRDYNRNNQAEISVLTDGRLWRFYLAGAAGEFGQKCFEAFDVLSAELSIDDLEKKFRSFLSRENLLNGSAVDQAKVFLRRTDDQRTMFDVLPIALRDAELDPTTSKVDCFIQRCSERGVSCAKEDARQFILNSRAVPAPMAPAVREIVTQSAGEALSIAQSRHTGIVTSLPRTPQSDNGRTLSLSGRRGANASGRKLVNGRFLVYANSVAQGPTPSFIADGSKSYRQFEELRQQRILELQSDGTFKLIKDFEFSSWSAAASVFMGTSASGPREWN
ncbi:MAG: DUF4357 domain-containing protein [Candidatus Dechloromonas phosphoritropha]|jgi:hypothetical protein